MLQEWLYLLAQARDMLMDFSVENDFNYTKNPIETGREYIYQQEDL